MYASWVLFVGFVSFGPLQFRLVDALIPLSIIFGPPAIVGVTVGCFIGNLLSPFNLGPVDILGGPAANFLAATLAWLVARRAFRGAWALGVSLQIAVISLIVGTYVVILAGAPGVPFWVGWVGFLGSEIVPVGIVGYPLLKAAARATRRAPIFTQNAS